MPAKADIQYYLKALNTGLRGNDVKTRIVSVQGVKGSEFKGLNSQRVSGLDPNYGAGSKSDCDLLKLAEIKQPLNLGTLNL